MKAFCDRIHVPWLAPAVAIGGGMFAAVNAGLWQATAFLPAIIAAAALEQRRER